MPRNFRRESTLQIDSNEHDPFFLTLKFKWRTFIIGYSIILTARYNSKRTRRFEITTVNRSGLTSYVSIGSTSISQKNVAKFFTAFTNTYDPLIILRPS